MAPVETSAPFLCAVSLLGRRDRLTLADATGTVGAGGGAYDEVTWGTSVAGTEE